MATLEQQLRASLIAGASTDPASANDSGARLYFRGEYDYEKLPGVGITALKEMRKSPKHYRHRLTHPRKETRALGLGTDTHVATLEPDRFLKEYALWTSEHPDGKKRPRNGKEWEAFVEQHKGKRIILDTEYDEAIAISQAVRADALAMKYLGSGRPEVAVTWTDAETGVLCRGRVDWLTMNGLQPCFVDLKSARDADPFWFTRDAAKLDYHLQCAYYHDALVAITGREPLVVVVAVESFAPYDVVTYTVPEDVLEIGRDGYRDLLVKLKECSQRDDWPGKGGGVERQLSLPHWAVPGEDEDASGLNLDWSTR